MLTNKFSGVITPGQFLVIALAIVCQCWANSIRAEVLVTHLISTDYENNQYVNSIRPLGGGAVLWELVDESEGGNPDESKIDLFEFRGGQTVKLTEAESGQAYSLLGDQYGPNNDPWGLYRDYRQGTSNDQASANLFRLSNSQIQEVSENGPGQSIGTIRTVNSDVFYAVVDNGAGPYHVDLHRFDGLQSTPITNNLPNQISNYERTIGNLHLIRQWDYTQGTGQNQRFGNVQSYDGASLVDLTNFGPGVFPDAFNFDGVEMYFRVTDATAGTSSDLLNQSLWMTDGVTARAISSQTPGHRGSYNARLGSDIIFTEENLTNGAANAVKIQDIHRHDGVDATNLSNNSAGRRSEYLGVVDGNIAYTTFVTLAAGGTYSDLFIHDGTSSLKITDHGVSQFVSTRTISGGNLYFERVSDFNTSAESRDLFLFDGTTLTNLTDNAPGQRSYMYSPTGNAVYFYTHDYTQGTVFTDLSFATGTNVINLSNNTSGKEAGGPQFVEGGAYFHNYDGQSDLTDLYFFDGTSVQQLTANDPGLHSHYAGITNGVSVVVTTDYSNNFADVLTLEDGFLTNVTNHEPGQYLEPIYQFDSQLYFILHDYRDGDSPQTNFSNLYSFDGDNWIQHTNLLAGEQIVMADANQGVLSLQIDSYDENGEFIGSDLAIFYEGAFTRLTNVSNGATASFGSNDPQFRTFIVQVDRGDGMDFLLVEILAQPIPEPSGAAILLLGLAIFPRLRRGLQAADRR